MITDLQMIEGFKKCIAKYGIVHASRIEQLARNETAHFKSSNFLATFGFGMEAVRPESPYGWVQLFNYWIANPQYAPIGIFEQVENTSKLAASKGVKRFIKFPSFEASLMSVSELIKIRGNNAGTWFSKNPAQIAAYNKELDKIIPRFCRSLTPKLV